MNREAYVSFEENDGNWTQPRNLGESVCTKYMDRFPMVTGDGYSTVEDLLNFDIALRSHKLLSEENFKLMTSGKVARNAQTQYAYLFQEKFVNGHRIIGHGGGAGGINSHLAMYMDLGYTVAIMANYDPPAAEKVASRLEELLTRRK